MYSAKHMYRIAKINSAKFSFTNNSFFKLYVLEDILTNFREIVYGTVPFLRLPYFY